MHTTQLRGARFLLAVLGALGLVALVSACDSEGPVHPATPAVLFTATPVAEANQLPSRTPDQATATPRPAITLKVTPTPDLIFAGQALAFSDPMHGWFLGSEYDQRGWTPVGTAAMRTTTDGGQTWQPAPAPRATVAEFAYQRDPDTVHYMKFANTQDGWAYGPSLFSTHDGGMTWRAEPTADPVLALEPKDGSVWAFENSCKQEFGRTECRFNLTSSDDLGRTWQDLPNQPPAIGTLVQLVRVSKDEAYVYSGGEVDQPQLWSGIPVYSAGLLVKTTDGGKTWQNLGQPTNFPCYSAYLGSPAKDVLWLLCASDRGAGNQPKSALLSQDGGKTWKVVAQTQNERCHCGAPGAGDLDWTGYVRTFAAQSASRAYLSVDQMGLYVTNDGGKTWQLPYEGPHGRAGYAQTSVIFVDSLHGWFADYFMIARTTDGGETWDGAEVR